MKYRIDRSLVPVGTIMSLLGVGAGTIRRWRHEEGMPHIVIPGNSNVIILYEMFEVVEWAKQRSMEIKVYAAQMQNRKQADLWRLTLKL